MTTSTEKMQPLSELRQVAMDTSHRKFLALFPSGMKNCEFIDPALGVFLVEGFGCAFYVRDFHSIEAIFVDST